MSTVRLGINGFGRIGRLTFRSTFAANKNVGRVMAINDPFMDKDYIAYLLKYDSVHGRFPHKVEVVADGITVDGELVKEKVLLIMDKWQHQARSGTKLNYDVWME